MRTFEIGEVIPIRILGASRKLDKTIGKGRVVAVSPDTVDFVYTDDSAIFPGLRGLLRLPRGKRP